MRKTILIISLTCLFSMQVLAQQTYDFMTVDKTTYELYQTGKWKELTLLAKKAIREGTDYFYLRLRNGIAFYNLGNYMQAETNLLEALEFNPGDRTAIEYLYYCYLMQNKGNKALSLLEQAPGSLRLKLKELYPPRFSFIHMDGGTFLSNQDNKYKSYDLDGKDDIYGEADIFNKAYYFSAGGQWFTAPVFSAYLGYTFLTLDRNKHIMSGDTVMIDHPYKVDQHQLYLSGTLYAGNGFSITPAFHFLNYRMNTVFAVYDSINYSYTFPDTSVNTNNYIGFLGLDKDYDIIRAGIFGALAHLNEQEQYQAGFDVTAFPGGNLDYYIQGQFVAHFNDGDLQPLANIMVGIRLLKPVWMELTGSFGEVENYFEKNASSVYNFSDRLRYRYGVKLIATLSSRWLLSLDYQYLGKESDILVYEEQNHDGTTVFVPGYHSENYIDHFFIASLLWKF